jgi:hypothetical protein
MTPAAAFILALAIGYAFGFLHGHTRLWKAIQSIDIREALNSRPASPSPSAKT